MSKRRLGALDRARITVKARQLFHRERVSTDTRVQAIFAYFTGASYRRVCDLFGNQFTKDAVRYWWNRASHLFDYVGGPHAVVAVDETAIQIGMKRLGRPHMLWAGIDTQTLQIVSLKLSRHTYMLDCRDFLYEIQHRSWPDQPIIIHDKGPWYPIQCQIIGLRHHEVVGGTRSLIEMWNRHLKHRLDRFWRTFPPNTRPMQAARWIRAWTAMWNLTRGW